ncbi:MAG: hypothetical protein EB141_02310 [Verrucomicrobia bacterium]|nr:hypothetical protein [Verrucomicrobiota bacterium]NDB74477.1 hypothetical protein [Verrucomicrobiota bacterium]
MKLLVLATTLLALVVSASAAPAGNTLDGIERGPYFTGTIKSSFPVANNLAMKGIVVSVGANRDVHVCYDTDLMRVSVAWAGDYLKFGKSQVEIVHPQPPEVAGKPLFGTQTGPGWAKDGKFEDPRENKQGRLPTEWAKYRGLYLNGWNVVLKYTVGGADVLEMPGVETAGEAKIVTRTIELDSKTPQTLLVCDGVPAGGSTGAKLTLDLPTAGNEPAQSLAIAVQGGQAISLANENGRLIAKIPAGKQSFRLALWKGAKADFAPVEAALNSAAKLPSLAALTKGAPGRWTQPVVTQAVPGTGDGPYVVDDITPPVPNPWNSKTFFGGFDFLPDGRAAVACFHGDVWIVSGLNDPSGKLSWKRFATGMFQPLGLKVVDGQIYVTCRDQLTRLHDLNGDGEADFYECFNNDTVVTPNYHEFCLDLHTDAAGNFFYGKGAPWPPTVQSPHQGTMIKVSKDGSKLEVIATGLRAPNGSTLGGPNGWLTVSDNEGHYMPASKLNLLRPGGFYGMRQSAHGKAPPEDKLNDYDQPICWLPKSQDNSSGGQAWVTSKQWGPFENHLLFTSYGMGTLFHVMTEEVDGQVQAGMTPFPLKFPSGTMRGRFNPKDGQLYLTGLRGWQTRGTRDGAFTRVRYTGKPVDMPHSLHVTKTGVQITFTRALDTATAADAANWAVERWDYLYSGNYGSKEYSNLAKKEVGHEKLDVKSVRVAPDKKTVFLEIPDMKPVMQMKVKCNIKAADGADVSQEIYNTIHKLAER